MRDAFKNNRLLWLAMGVIVGSLGVNLLPHEPLYASATHGQDGMVIATGEVDDGVEGIYVLDSLTGDLKGAVLNPSTRKFGVIYEYNILKDFAAAGVKSPKFMMVTGDMDPRRGVGKVPLGRDAIYVYESSSGTMAAYGVPWGQGVPAASPFVPLDRMKFRTVAIREQ